MATPQETKAAEVKAEKEAEEVKAAAEAEEAAKEAEEAAAAEAEAKAAEEIKVAQEADKAAQAEKEAAEEVAATPYVRPSLADLAKSGRETYNKAVKPEETKAAEAAVKAAEKEDK